MREQHVAVIFLAGFIFETGLQGAVNGWRASTVTLFVGAASGLYYLGRRHNGG